MIYVVVGPTGVGKTSLSLKLAKEIGAEIISCDSMQVYKELNIGTAKIKDEEKEEIGHHLLDVVSVKDEFSVANYQMMARKVLNSLLNANKNVVIVGGTGLYLKALLYDYTFDKSKNISKPLYDFKLIGLTMDRTKLYERIDERVDLMINRGLVDEVKSLFDRKIDNRVVVKTAIGYKELYDYFLNKTTLDEAINKIKQASRRYAKRQYTWFNHQFDNIIWYNVDELSIDEIVNDVLRSVI